MLHQAGGEELHSFGHDVSASTTARIGATLEGRYGKLLVTSFVLRWYNADLTWGQNRYNNSGTITPSTGLLDDFYPSQHNGGGHKYPPVLRKNLENI